MKNIIKQSIYKGAFIIAVAVLFLVVGSAQAQAAVSWGPITGDCPTVMMGNNTTGQHIASHDRCWESSPTTNADAGQNVNIRIFYDNSGTSPATNTTFHLTSPGGASTTQSFTASYTSQGVSKSGTGTVILSSSQTLTYNKAVWFPNNYTIPAREITNGMNLFGAGLDLGTISPGIGNSGSLVVSFLVSNNTTSNCTIGSFDVTPSVTSGQTASISWSTSGCASVSVTGPGVSDARPNGSLTTPAITTNSTYTINARNSSGVLSTQSRTVTVNTPTSTCVLSIFRVNPPTINAGQTSNVVWYSSGCTSVSISGYGVSDTRPSGYAVTPALNSNTTYTMTGRDASGSVAPKTATVVVVPVISANCRITGFSGPTSPIASGSTATLTWSTSNCNSVSISGLSIPSTQTNGSVTTPALSYTTTYTLSATGTGGTFTQDFTVSVNTVSPTCRILSFDGPTGAIPYNTTAMLVWNTQNCNSVSIGGVSVPSTQTSGYANTPALTYTQSYTLNAYGTSGSDSRTTTVTVLPNTPTPSNNCIITQFTPSAVSVPSGSTATIYWSTYGCTNVSIVGTGLSFGSQPMSGQVTTGSIYGSNRYTISAYGSNPWSPATQTLTITSYDVPVPPPNPYPYPYPYPPNPNPYPYPTQSCVISSFYASPTQVVYGGTTNLIWNTYGCSSVSITGGSLYSYGNQSLSGNVTTGAIYNSTNYTITAYGSYGSSPSPQTVYVYLTNQNGNQTSPSVTTYSATGTSQNTATLNGYVSTGSTYYGGNSATYYFQYGTDTNSMYNNTPSQTMSGYSGNISTYLTNLTPNTTYYFRAVAQNSYGTNYGTTLSFVTGGSQVITDAKVVTSIATGVYSGGARLNGIVVVPAGYNTASAYFEYGTDLSLGHATNPQTFSTNIFMNYYDVVSALPNTTYYFRAVGTIGGTVYRGATVSYTTPSATTHTTIVTTTPGTGTGSKNVMLTISDQFQNISAGDTLSYTVTYKNISGGELTNTLLNVVLPSGVTFKRATIGTLTTNNTVAVTLGNLPKDASGTITIEGVADNVKNGDSLIATATLAFALPSTAQDNAVAYALNNVTGSTTNNPGFLAGLAIFGVDFFPKTFLGWIFLIGLVILVVALVRRLYPRQQPVMVNHGHPVGNSHPENLPH